ncbi:hypothetical protein BGZ79_002246 [Entomortierella chlamydospora]|nr:hypothetical protein BGZ79_002246 [Entomortierella chlamydospora]
MLGEHENITMFQFFEWYSPADKQHWVRLKEQASLLSSLGLSAIWIPPPMKGISEFDVGYAPYDLWDFGEFDQKGTIPTKYGTKDELKAAIEECHKHGVKVYLDAVLNHKAGGDEIEVFKAIPVAEDDRNKELGEAYDIEAYTKFLFKGRNKKYSDFQWHFHHFTGTDWDAREKKKYDIDGFRIDALKHTSAGFIAHLLNHVRKNTDRKDFFAVGEYWKDDVGDLESHVENNGGIHLFDVPLHFNFARASKEGNSFDMRTIFDGTFVKTSPESAVTFIDNHDTQPYQSLESFVEPWFKPLAAALICLRFDGYPCLFYGDFYGIEPKCADEPETGLPGRKEMFSRVLLARKEFAYGSQNDYFDHVSCVGWVRYGDEHHPKGLAVVMSNSEAGSKTMDVGKDKAGQVWVDMMGYWKEPVTINEDGWADFHCHAGSVSIWVQKEEGKSWVTCEESTLEEEEKGKEEQQADLEAEHPELPKPLDDGWEHLLEDDKPKKGRREP